MFSGSLRVKGSMAIFSNIAIIALNPLNNFFAKQALGPEDEEYEGQNIGKPVFSGIQGKAHCIPEPA